MNETIQLVNFLIEAGKLGNVERKLHAIGSIRRENVAEHTYHMVLTAVLLLENRLSATELLKVIKIILVHDLGEIGADDLAFNKKTANQVELEEKAYSDMVSLLPVDKQQEYFQLWKEFEELSTKEALYAKAIDKLQSQIVVYSHLLNDPNYQFINTSTVSETKRLIWGYIRDVFGKQFEFIIDKIKPSLVQE
jgi:putative hydrolases of HD superfamily